MKKILLMILVISALVLAGCKCTGDEQKGDNLIVDAICKTYGAGSGEEPQLRQDHCYQKFGLLTGNINLCYKIQAPAPKSKCLLRFVAEGKAVGTYICDDMEMMYQPREGTYNPGECWQRLAEKTGNKEFCNNVPKDWHSSGSDVTSHSISYFDCRERAGEKEQCGDEYQPCCSGGCWGSSTKCEKGICVKK
ncbi:hypothetical protein KY328_02820 [Candidatus Woesearchaeota archaeon]|nr:hypothetical protein [Candidatus Woesearchaeota archaeon]MBW3021826.1 hypothetical protein [Candidatus Woesearchaeota archaeon]